MDFAEERSAEDLNKRLRPFLEECLDPAMMKGKEYELSVEETIFGILQTVYVGCLVSEKYDTRKAKGYFQLMGEVAIEAYHAVVSLGFSYKAQVIARPSALSYHTYIKTSLYTKRPYQ